MDESLLTLLEELSLRASCSEDEANYYCKQGPNSAPHNARYLSSDYTSSSDISSPAHDQLDNIQATDEDIELKSAVNSLFQELSTPNPSSHSAQLSNFSAGYDKSKLLVALLGNIDHVTCAIKKINQLVSLGKKMELIYRRFYADPTVPLDLDEVNRLITAFSEVYNGESYVREVNVSRVYQAYCKKLIDIYEARKNNLANASEETMMLDQ